MGTPSASAVKIAGIETPGLIAQRKKSIGSLSLGMPRVPRPAG
jgi:hypothetical protein